jgi:hypothetical protein
MPCMPDRSSGVGLLMRLAASHERAWLAAPCSSVVDHTAVKTNTFSSGTPIEGSSKRTTFHYSLQASLFSFVSLSGTKYTVPHC